MFQSSKTQTSSDGKLTWLSGRLADLFMKMRFAQENSPRYTSITGLSQVCEFFNIEQQTIEQENMRALIS